MRPDHRALSGDGRISVSKKQSSLATRELLTIELNFQRSSETVTLNFPPSLNEKMIKAALMRLFVYLISL